MIRLLLWVLPFLLSAAPADAAFVGAAMTALGASAAAAAAVQAFVVRTAASLALSALGRAIRGTPRAPGISTEVTTNGGITPQSFIVGRYATAGQMVAPAMSYGSAGKTPLAYLVYDIALSAIARATLSRVVINDNYVTLGASGASWGRPVTGDLSGYAWVDYRDGTQTTAHPDMLAAFGGAATRPWSADMVGRGVCEAVIRFKYDRERYNSWPTVRFELLGIPLYDPRADTSVGGSGPQRWSSTSTWTQTENLVVIIYNIMRGITLEDGSVWGCRTPAEDLPLSSWMAAMNECDRSIALEAGGTEPQFRGGYEIALNMEPQEVINELKKACAAEMAEFGGVWKIRVGPPALPVYFLTDDTIIFTAPEELDQFPGLAATYNGVEASYPEPASLWKSKDAPSRYNATWEAEDGGQRLIAGLQYPACPYQSQVQRLMAAAIKDERRHRRHTLTLPPSAAILEPLDTISWTSSRNGYAGKIFEVASITDTLMTANQFLTVRECDPADYDWVPTDELPVAFAPPGIAARAAQSVPGWGVAAAVLTDAGGTARRPAIAISWDPEGAEDASGIRWEARLAGGVDPVLSGTHASIRTAFSTISDGLIPGEHYEVRAELIVDRPVNWTSWTAVTVPAVLVSAPDIAAESIDDSHIASLSADKITAGVMNARHLEVTELLRITDGSGALSVGKISAYDLEHDGAYFGRTLGPGGLYTAGFLAGKKVGGVDQYIQATDETGLKLVNASYRVSGAAAPAYTTITMSQTVTLPVGIRGLTLDLIGGGGGGKGGTGDGGGSGADGGAGGTTTVQLWDGAVNTGLSWTSVGGAGSTATTTSDTAGSGQSSPIGVGGAGYRRASGGDATGFGAGGGGGGDTLRSGLGGSSSSGVATQTLDISAYANPKLVIVIGAGGLGGGTGRKGGSGSPGRVVYSTRAAADAPANVLPLQPTFSGSIVKAASSALTFPAYGAGLWILSVTGSAALDLGQVETHVSGQTVRVLLTGTATIISDKTPVDLASSAGAYTVDYQFYKLSEWAS